MKKILILLLVLLGMVAYGKENRGAKTSTSGATDSINAAKYYQEAQANTPLIDRIGDSVQEFADSCTTATKRYTSGQGEQALLQSAVDESALAVINQADRDINAIDGRVDVSDLLVWLGDLQKRLKVDADDIQAIVAAENNAVKTIGGFNSQLKSDLQTAMDTRKEITELIVKIPDSLKDQSHKSELTGLVNSLNRRLSGIQRESAPSFPDNSNKLKALKDSISGAISLIEKISDELKKSAASISIAAADQQFYTALRNRNSSADLNDPAAKMRKACCRYRAAKALAAEITDAWTKAGTAKKANPQKEDYDTVIKYSKIVINKIAKFRCLEHKRDYSQCEECSCDDEDMACDCQSPCGGCVGTAQTEAVATGSPCAGANPCLAAVQAHTQLAQGRTELARQQTTLGKAQADRQISDARMADKVLKNKEDISLDEFRRQAGELGKYAIAEKEAQQKLYAQYREEELKMRELRLKYDQKQSDLNSRENLSRRERDKGKNYLPVSLSLGGFSAINGPKWTHEDLQQSTYGWQPLSTGSDTLAKTGRTSVPFGVDLLATVRIVRVKGAGKADTDKNRHPGFANVGLTGGIGYTFNTTLPVVYMAGLSLVMGKPNLQGRGGGQFLITAGIAAKQVQVLQYYQYPIGAQYTNPGAVQYSKMTAIGAFVSLSYKLCNL